MAMRQRSWTTREVETLRNYRLAGYTVAEIAAKLGRTPHSVRWKIKQLQLPRGVIDRDAWSGA